MKVTLVIFIFVSMLASCTSDKISRSTIDPNNKFVGFAIYPPIVDADPSVRTSREFEVPAKLNIERTENQIAVSVDRKSLKKISLNVGKNMVTGFKSNIIIYRGNEILSAGREGLSGGAHPANSTDYFNREQDKFPVPGEEYRVEMKFSIFETDIPVQHMWSPQSSKYKVLWSDTISAISK